MSRATRINLIGVLSLGYIAVALGIVKASYQVKRDPDRTFAQHLNVYGFLQLNVGIIAACIPTLKPLLRSNTRRTQTPRRSAYADIEHAATIGSARQTKPNSRRLDTDLSTIKGGGATVMTTTTMTTEDETYEMVAHKGVQQRGVGEVRGMGYTDGEMGAQKQWEYGLGAQVRHIDAVGRQFEGGDKREILCTTEVVIDREVRKGVGFAR